MHKLKILNGDVFLDDKKISGVSEYEIKSSTTEKGTVEELSIKIRVTVDRVCSE